MSTRANALRISVAAMFVALTILVAYLPTIPGSAFKFSGFPLLVAGLLVGPRTGFAVGCLTDIVNFALHPTGPFFPGFTLTQGLTCMLPGLCTVNIDPLTGQRIDALREDRQLVTQKLFSSLGIITAYLRILLIFGLAKIITSVALVSFFTSKVVMGTPLAYELLHRALIQAVHVPIYALLALGVLKGLARTDLYFRILRARR